jgi:signal peptidase I
MKAASSIRLLRRATTIVGAAVALAVFVAPVRAGISSHRQLAAILSHTPAAQIVSEGQQMAQAEHAAARIPGAQAFWGVGQSMQPLYAPNTALVVKPVSYDDIKKGMTVVYVKKNGHVVAHSVVDEDGKGYVVQGVNNNEADPESVNEHNMIGVVVAAYSASGSQFRGDVARRLAVRDGIALAADHG